VSSKTLHFLIENEFLFWKIQQINGLEITGHPEKHGICHVKCAGFNINIMLPPFLIIPF